MQQVNKIIELMRCCFNVNTNSTECRQKLTYYFWFTTNSGNVNHAANQKKLEELRQRISLLNPPEKVKVFAKEFTTIEFLHNIRYEKAAEELLFELIAAFIAERKGDLKQSINLDTQAFQKVFQKNKS